MVELTAELIADMGVLSDPQVSPDGRLVSQAESEKLYGAAPASLKSEAAE